VNDVAVGQLAVGGLDLSELVENGARGAHGTGVQPTPLYGAARVAGREQGHVVSGELEPARQMVHHELRAAVLTRRNGHPVRSDQPRQFS
jgi:hypothetical protein